MSRIEEIQYYLNDKLMNNEYYNQYNLVFGCVFFVCFLGEKMGVRKSDKSVISSDFRYLEITVSVQQKIAGFQVSMKHISRVDILESAQDLVEEVAHVLVADRLRFQQLVQVRFHEALHDVHVLHLLDRWRSDYVLDVDYLLFINYKNQFFFPPTF